MDCLALRTDCVKHFETTGRWKIEYISPPWLVQADSNNNNLTILKTWAFMIYLQSSSIDKLGLQTSGGHGSLLLHKPTGKCGASYFYGREAIVKGHTYSVLLHFSHLIGLENKDIV